MISKISEEFSKEDESQKKFPSPQKQAKIFQNLLFGVSFFLVSGTAILQLDLVPSVLLGCAVIGFNYFWTTKLVRKLLLLQKLQTLDIFFILTKFGISIIVLLGAFNLGISPKGLLIGISNVALAAIIYTFLRVFKPGEIT